jgi:hypothetical protein
LILITDFINGHAIMGEAREVKMLVPHHIPKAEKTMVKHTAQ